MHNVLQTLVSVVFYVSLQLFSCNSAGNLRRRHFALSLRPIRPSFSPFFSMVTAEKTFTCVRYCCTQQNLATLFLCLTEVFPAIYFQAWFSLLFPKNFLVLRTQWNAKANTYRNLLQLCQIPQNTGMEKRTILIFIGLYFIATEASK